METFFTLLAFCAGNSPVTGEFPSQRQVTRMFDVFFDLRLNKRLGKQSRGWWFEMPARSSWRHCNVKRQIFFRVQQYEITFDMNDKCLAHALKNRGLWDLFREIWYWLKKRWQKYLYFLSLLVRRVSVYCTATWFNYNHSWISNFTLVQM